ncbi:uncharacterized protein LOC133882641 isoform X3 [Alnus glutinosa]|uniref:uncharacterized protein LOC133882641 isoform X3 n=1 Tax=Alnus glutinosa TaxID=3517 RepID=UPI002D79EF82|nr:uncharacterized protein LOC133882641 isoform X3 [Alnus glutinosa]
MEVADATDVGLSPSTPKGKEFQIPVISFNTLPAAPKRKPVWSRMEGLMPNKSRNSCEGAWRRLWSLRKARGLKHD